MDWTEAYRPRSLADIVGNGPSVKKLRDWAESWRRGIPDKRAVVLSGPPGVGKTSAALALAADMGWSVIELNASDARNAERIRRVATAGAMHQTFADDGSFHRGSAAAGAAASPEDQGASKLIILDEADNLYERLSGESAAGGGTELGDRGGKVQIVQTIRETKQPIILIVNDLYELTKGSGSALKGLAETLKWQRVNVRSIPAALQRITDAEGVKVDRPVLEAIAQNAGGDLRAAVRDLQSLCAGRKHVTLHHMASAGYRDSSGTVFDVVRHVLKGRSMRELRREVMNLDMTPADIVLWIDENLPKEYQSPDDLVRGYDMLSKADRFLGRTTRTQNYRLWAYASDLSTAGVMAARQHEYKKFVPFGFPQWLSKMSRSKGARQTKDALAESLGRATHQSKRKARDGQVEVFTALFAADDAFAARQTARLDLAADQVAVLVDDKPTSTRVKAIMEAAAAIEVEAPARPATGLDRHFDDADEASAEEEAGDHAEGSGEDRSERRAEPGDGQQRLF